MGRLIAPISRQSELRVNYLTKNVLHDICNHDNDHAAELYSRDFIQLNSNRDTTRCYTFSISWLCYPLVHSFTRNDIFLLSSYSLLSKNATVCFIHSYAMFISLWLCFYTLHEKSPSFFLSLSN